MIEALGAHKTAEDRASARFAALAARQLKLVILAQVRGLTTPLATISFPILVLIGVYQGVPLSKIVLLWSLQAAVFQAAQGFTSLWPAWLRLSPTVGMIMDEMNRAAPPCAPDELFAKRRRST